MIEEVWATIPEFPLYQISNLGRVYNDRQHMFMRTSVNNHGHVKITLMVDTSHRRFTRSVAYLVAEAFVEKPNILCDQVVILDGNLSNVVAHNLAWRPKWFQWKYTRQLKINQPRYYHNLPVRNVLDGREYNSIIEAGMDEGLLFEDIWRSTYTASPVYPTGSVFEVIERV